jgi:tetratricopeptide (TPR) repeat protein
LTFADQMLENGRVLEFRPKAASAVVSRLEALAAANRYLSYSVEERSETAESTYMDADVLMAICGLLRERVNEDAAGVLTEATNLHSWLTSRKEGIGFFDERDYFLGESSLLAGCATRLLGDRSEAELWLDRADAAYRHTINPTPNLARVSYIRLTLRYDMHRHREVLELVPSVALTFEKLGIYSELVKCWLLEAMSMKALGLGAQSARRLEALIARPEFAGELSFRALALLNLGNLRSEEGHLDRALQAFQEALPILSASNNRAALADLRGMVGDTLRSMGKLDQAILAYRQAVEGYVNIGMKTRVAYFRTVTAEALLEAGRLREAEWEILAALPTIDEQRMAQEGLAAVALLRESVARRKTDSGALAQVREHLQAQA